jgi:hypothetical protein
MDYLRVLTDPFGYDSPSLPCIPDLLDLPSYKVHTLNRFTAAVGTAGVGYVVVWPRIFSNDQTAQYFTQSTFSSSTIEADGFVGTLSGLNANFPYSAATTRDCRVVSCGVRVRYTGTELDRGGRIIIRRYTSGESVPTGAFATASALLSSPLAQTLRVDRNWHGTAFRPTLSSHTDYQHVSSLTDPLVVFFEGKPGITFEIEVVRYFEIIPRTNTSNPPAVQLGVPTTTTSHSDITAVSMIRDFLGSAHDALLGSGAYQLGLSYIKARYLGGPISQPVIEYM